MKKISLTLVLLLVASAAYAGLGIKRFPRDIKLPSQQMIEKAHWAAPIDATTNYIKTTIDGPSSAAAYTLSSFTHQPDVPRNITITPGGTTADVKGCTVVVNGTNVFGNAISENFVFADNASSATTGNKAFKTVTSIVLPINCEEGSFEANWIVGVGTKLGLPRCTSNAGAYIWSVFNGAYETSRGTMASSATAVESNTFIPNGSMDGEKDVDLFYIQNFGCAPN